MEFTPQVPFGRAALAASTLALNVTKFVLSKVFKAVDPLTVALMQAIVVLFTLHEAEILPQLTSVLQFLQTVVFVPFFSQVPLGRAAKTAALMLVV